MVDRNNQAVRFFAPVAVRQLLSELLGTRSVDDAIKVDVTFDLNPAIPERILAGEIFDLAITNPWYVSRLIDAGKVLPGSHVPFGSVPLAVGATTAQFSGMATTQDAIATLLRSAEAIAYTSQGTSGQTFLEVMRRMGVLEEIAGRLVPMGAGGPAAALAEGQVDLAIGPLTTFIAAAGADPVAIFPTELGTDIEMSVFQQVASTAPKQAAAVIAFLTGPEIDSYLAVRGMNRFTFR